MIIKKKQLLAFLPLALPLLSSCINSDYDLSDLDTNARVEVKDLVVPVNIDAFSLDKVISLSDDSQIKEVTDPITGNKIYAVLKEGTFDSNEINIPTITVNSPSINPISSTISLEKLNNELDDKVNTLEQDAVELLVQAGHSETEAWSLVRQNEGDYKQQAWDYLKDGLKNTPLAKYEFNHISTSFSASTNNVDKAIRGISDIKGSATLKIAINISNLSGIIKDVKLNNVKLQLPKGLTLNPSQGSYNKENGVLDLSYKDDLPTIKNASSYELTVDISEISPADAGVTFSAKKGEAGTFTFANNVEVIQGDIELYCSDFVDGKTFFDLPDKVSYSCAPSFSNIYIEKVSGTINYEIDGVNVDPVYLNDIPDLLSGNQTNIFLGNPQVYIKVNNPATKYGAYAETGLSIYGDKNGVKRETYTLDNKTVKIDADENIFCIAPTKPAKYYPNYENAEFEPFSGLKKVVCGEGLPSAIHVNIDNTCIPEQEVKDIELGESIDKVHGQYTFYAPLALDEGSIIVYDRTEDGWSSETLDKVTITKLHVTATASSEIPLDATVSIYPIDKNGNRINGVEFSNATLKANEANQEFVFEQTSGTINNLDGIVMRASITGNNAEDALAPYQTIEVKDLKATVSGYYEDEF